MSSEIDKPGCFYLGRRHSVETGLTADEPVLYDSKHLTTHAVCVGMTGSGKTGLCLSLLEEAGLNGIPAIAIDPKGDLGNLLLTFPEFRSADFRPWIDESVAAREGKTPDELAAQTAELWKNGLAKWGQDPSRVARYNSAVDKTIYTPGSNAGVPLTILKSFAAPPQAVLDDSDALNERVQSAASGVLALLGMDVDPVTSREHILLSNVLSHAWRAGRDLDLVELIREIQDPPFRKVGVVDLDSFLSAKERLAIGMQLNNLLASPSFASWMEGEPLDVQRLLYTPEGRPRLSILSISHLNDAERMFFVTILLNETLSWMRSQPGTGSLRALLYMDEVYGYFPPLGNPPAKRPMLTLMKQARAFGLGCVLATQNPVDLDYKGLSNAGTWFLGRLQTERDKLRVIEGLEGASSQAGASFNRARMEQTLAGLGNRVFLMNNVHDAQPTIFQTRWAMSYLSGPLSRTQISRLMAEKRKASIAASTIAATAGPASTGPASTGVEATGPPSSGAPSTDSQMSGPSASRGSGEVSPGAVKARSGVGHASRPPLLSADVPQCYAAVRDERPAEARLSYRPGLAGEAKLHFVKASDNIDVWRSVLAIEPLHGEEIASRRWDAAIVYDETSAPRLDVQPFGEAEAAGVRYAELPSELAQEKNYRQWEGDLREWLYQTQRMTLWRCEALDALSEEGESEAEFRTRVAEQAQRQCAARQDEIRRKFAARIKRQEEAVAKAEAEVAEQKSQFLARVGQMLWRLAEILLIRFSGGRTRKQVVTSGSATQAMRERRQSTRAADRLADEERELADLRDQVQAEIDLAERDYAPQSLALEKLEVGPRKADIAVDRVALVWLPWWEKMGGAREPAY